MKHLLVCMHLMLMVSYSCASQWAVVTTINYPTEGLKKLAQLPDWHVVVVADKKTPTDWHLPGCYFLSIEQQKTLGYRIIDILPWNHYCRKSIGYLYAIEHGATVIYDTDDDNILLHDITYLPTTASTTLIQTTDSVYNPYHYFGQPAMWPRGYPLANILSQAKAALTKTSTRPLIQQGLVNEDPDVDALYRLTQGALVQFQDNDPITLPVGCMCPFNSQNTVLHYDAFWALLIPCTTTFRVCDIWRGYWAQRLVWEIGGTLCFMPPSVIQKRNEHNLLNDFIQEIDLYTQSGKLVTYLLQIQLAQPTLFERMVALTKGMIDQGFYQQRELELVHAWLEDLRDVGYIMPAARL